MSGMPAVHTGTILKYRWLAHAAFRELQWVLGSQA